jgi:hypothetical protein
MNTQSINPSNAPYENVLAAWREQRIQALAIPALAQQLSLQERELLPRFAAQYTRLRACPGARAEPCSGSGSARSPGWRCC